MHSLCLFRCIQRIESPPETHNHKILPLGEKAVGLVSCSPRLEGRVRYFLVEGKRGIVGLKQIVSGGPDPFE